MNPHPLGHVHYQLDVGIVVVIGASGDLVELGTCSERRILLSYLDILVRHTNVVCIGLQILWCRHNSELYGSLVSERLVRPFSYASDFFDRRNSVVGNEDLSIIM